MSPTGKCANRLLALSGLPLIARQMKVFLKPYVEFISCEIAIFLRFTLFSQWPRISLIFSSLLGCWRCCQRLDLSSIWALLAAFEDPLPVPKSDGFPLEGAFVKGVDSISWMANNSKKLLGSSSDGPNCWTFFSTADFGKRNKVPQVCS